MAASFLAALAGVLLWRLAKLPLPWLVGPLWAVAAARIVGLPLVAPPATRQSGQWVIGVGMGLYFSPPVAAELLAHAGLIAGMALASLLMGIASGVVLVRLRLASPATAFFSSMPGGANEMAHLAEQWQADVDLVAAAHATRVMLVVFVIPLALALWIGQGNAMAVVAAHEIHWSRLALMALASLCGAGLFFWWRWSNPWLLGTMSATAALGIAGVPLSALPDWLSAAGQLLVGLALGSYFEPGFMRKSPRFLLSIVVMSLLFMAATALISWLIAMFTHLSAANLILSFSPGGIAEMSITASLLHLGVPLVVAAHVTRVVLLTVCAPHVYRRFVRLFGAGSDSARNGKEA
ncbi:MAG: AbrB family transcriptional regulator [Betaproteobacteria bacterium]|nr:AbrB family transcriptional regulator [Betaproteobacteria bacterium]